MKLGNILSLRPTGGSPACLGFVKRKARKGWPPAVLNKSFIPGDSLWPFWDGEFTWPELKGCWWPPTIGDKRSRIESPGLDCYCIGLLVCVFLVSLHEVRSATLRILFSAGKSELGAGCFVLLVPFQRDYGMWNCDMNQQILVSMK